MDFEANILQTARIYSKATGKNTLLAVCSQDSLQVLPVCSIKCGITVWQAEKQKVESCQERQQVQWVEKRMDRKLTERKAEKRKGGE